MKKVDIKGLIVPIITPMYDDETINYDELRNHIERMILGGVSGIFPAGTNGENYILTEEEKLEIFRVTVNQVKGRVPVYAGTGCIGTKDTIELSRKAQKIGVDVLSIITPSFAKASQHEIYTHYSEIAENIDMPIVLYNIPARTGNAIEPETVRKLAENYKNIVGAKDSSGDWNNLKAYIDITKEIDGFSVLSGNDSLILDCLKNGGKGAIAGCTNVYPVNMVSIYKKFNEGNINEAQIYQDNIANFRSVFKYGNPNTVVKIATRLKGHPVGDCRRPFSYLSNEGRDMLIKVLEEDEKKGMK